MPVQMHRMQEREEERPAECRQSNRLAVNKDSLYLGKTVKGVAALVTPSRRGPGLVTTGGAH